MEKFTPVQRVEFPIDDVKVIMGDIDVRKLGWRATVEIYGKRYDVHGRACDLPRCYCDAEIIEESKQ